VIVATGSSNRQTKALAASVRDAVREAGFPKPRSEGEENGEWIIVDCGQAVAHIMQPAIRQYYRLEEIWGDTPVRLKLGAAKPRKLTASEDEAPAKGAAKPAGKAAAKKSAAVKKAPARKTAEAAAAPKKLPPKKPPPSKPQGHRCRREEARGQGRRQEGARENRGGEQARGQEGGAEGRCQRQEAGREEGTGPQGGRQEVCAQGLILKTPGAER